VITSLCDLTSATWSQTSALENDPVKLNIDGTNCEGKTIYFEVMRRNNGFLGLGQDVPATTEPANIVYSSDTYGTWTAEWVDDSPLRYYFIATVEGTSNSITSSKADADMLHVFQRDAACAGVSSCSNYNTEADCETNLCTVKDVPSTITCGGSFNPETGCYDYTNCGCSWDSVSGVCGANWDLQSSCGVCGNYIKDTGEQCDLGIRNGQPNSGCTSTCQFENGISSPCPEGTTLCSDGTCSLNCDITDTSVAPCNYNGICDSGEGCTCNDCDGQQDTCQNGLLCTIFNTACCTSVSDLICNPACSYIDPDCSPAICGNGFMELGEECDLGTRNQVADSGCSSTCTYEILEPPCPEGTALCNDGTCSLNCYATDKGVATCDPSKCAEGLQCSGVDGNACCYYAKDGYCDPYCASVDQDCKSKNTVGIFPIGTCSYTENGQDTCQNGGVLVRSLVASWTWDPANTQQSDPLGRSQNCVDIQDTLACPASVEVSFFGIYQLAIAAVVVVLIYLILALRKKSSSKHARRNSKNIGKKRKK
jgi:cysteine-rich repeat protein